MLDAVVECLVSRRNTMGTYIARFFMFLIDGIMLAASIFILLFIPGYFILVCVFAGIGWFVTWLVLRYTRVEFEYSFFDNELTVDKIYNKSKRKRMGRVSLFKLEYIALADSPRFQGPQQDKVLKHDYSAKDAELVDYTMYLIEDGKQPTMITITPNEELLEILKKKYSRKFVD